MLYIISILLIFLLYNLIIRIKNQRPNNKKFNPPNNALSATELFQFSSYQVKQHNHEIKSQSIFRLGVKYKINLAEYTCTCPYFEKKCSKYKSHNILRLCKHIRAALLLDGFLVDSPTKILFFEQIGLCDYYAQEEPDVFIGFSIGNPWIEVFLINNRERFSYNVKEKSWAGGYGPTPRKVHFKKLIREKYQIL